MDTALHFSSASEDWHTPQCILDRVYGVLGCPIDLDPCSAGWGEDLVVSRRKLTREDDGLKVPCWGADTVYINPPYGRQVARWVDKTLYQHEHGCVNSVILLVAARPDTRWFQKLLEYPVCLIRGRLTFGLPPLEPPVPDPSWEQGTLDSWERARRRRQHPEVAPFPSAVFYLGPDPRLFRAQFEDLGRLMQPCPVER